MGLEDPGELARTVEPETVSNFRQVCLLDINPGHVQGSAQFPYSSLKMLRFWPGGKRPADSVDISQPLIERPSAVSSGQHSGNLFYCCEPSKVSKKLINVKN